MHRFLQARDCYHHLRRLTNLLRLELSYLEPVPTPGNDVDTHGEEIVIMLSGMTRLQCLVLLSECCCAQTAHRLVTEDVPALPLLDTLALRDYDSVELTSCLLLAAKIRDGVLPLLQRVQVDLSVKPEQLAELNSCAARAVFTPDAILSADLNYLNSG